MTLFTMLSIGFLWILHSGGFLHPLRVPACSGRSVASPGKSNMIFCRQEILMFLLFVYFEERANLYFALWGTRRNSRKRTVISSVSVRKFQANLNPFVVLCPGDLLTTVSLYLHLSSHTRSLVDTIHRCHTTTSKEWSLQMQVIFEALAVLRTESSNFRNWFWRPWNRFETKVEASQRNKCLFGRFFEREWRWF